ncbi:MAG: hypothetical protein GEU88_10750 [Solirubrobacterales bacterium]|nr:hypothetical protein [Solirubrobacterales bacterium]
MSVAPPPRPTSRPAHRPRERRRRRRPGAPNGGSSLSRRTRRMKLVAASIAAAAGMTAAGAQAAPKLELVERPAERFESSIEAHKVEVRYRAALGEAEEFEVAPRDDLLEHARASRSELRHGARALDARIERAKRARSTGPSETELGLAGGVSQETLEAIASCESGGDPTAVDSSGTYYGKYQFDTGTWASVGGSGSPAAAPEAEQDYRASLLYSRAGSSPWPVCGG